MPLDNHEKGLLKPLPIDGRGDGLSSDIGGGDMACEGDTERVVDEARESAGGLSGNDDCVVVLECAVDACEPS